MSKQERGDCNRVSSLKVGFAAIAVAELGAIDGCLDRGGSWDYDHSRCAVATP
jgi:hypothetical protein